MWEQKNVDEIDATQTLHVCVDPAYSYCMFFIDRQLSQTKATIESTSSIQDMIYMFLQAYVCLSTHCTYNHAVKSFWLQCNSFKAESSAEQHKDTGLTFAFPGTGSHAFG